MAHCDPKSPNYPTMMEQGYLVHTDRGNRTQLECGGYEVFYDATHPGAREFVWDKIKKHYYDRGIKHFWLDAAEPETIPYHYDNFRYHMGSAWRWPTSTPITMKKPCMMA